MQIPFNLNVKDCAIRAISIALGKSWKSIYMDLTHEGCMRGEMPNSNKVIDSYLSSLTEVINYPKKSLISFNLNEGTYLIRVSNGKENHMTLVHNGLLIDTWDPSAYKIVKVFKVKDPNVTIDLPKNDQRRNEFPILSKDYDFSYLTPGAQNYLKSKSIKILNPSVRGMEYFRGNPGMTLGIYQKGNKVILVTFDASDPTLIKGKEVTTKMVKLMKGWHIKTLPKGFDLNSMKYFSIELL